MKQMTRRYDLSQPQETVEQMLKSQWATKASEEVRRMQVRGELNGSIVNPLDAKLKVNKVAEQAKRGLERDLAQYRAQLAQAAAAKERAEATRDLQVLQGVIRQIAADTSGELFELNDVEITNTSRYSLEELNWACRAYRVVDWVPVIKLGHVSAYANPLPSFGHAENMRLVDGTLRVDLVGIPATVWQMIARAHYDRVSIEPHRRYERGSFVWPFVIRAVALLGTDHPRAIGLEPLHKALMRQTQKKYAAKDDMQEIIARYGFRRLEQVVHHYLGETMPYRKIALHDSERALAELKTERAVSQLEDGLAVGVLKDALAKKQARAG